MAAAAAAAAATPVTIPTPDMDGWFAEREDTKLWPGAYTKWRAEVTSAAAAVRVRTTHDPLTPRINRVQASGSR